MDPWHDYLAFPIAPLTLAVQIGALFVRRRSLRWILGLACPAAIAAMFAYVTSLPDREGEGVFRELITAARRGSRPAEEETLQST